MSQTVVAFLTKLIPEQLRAEVDRLSKNNLQEAASALEWNLYRGLCGCLKQPIRIINVLPIGSYPQYYKRLFVRESTFTTPSGADNRNLGFCNLKLLRKRSQSASVYRALREWCRENPGEKLLFVYTVCSEFMIAVSKLKREFPHLTVCAIVADLPNMTSLAAGQNRIIRRYVSASASKSYALLDCVDCFVLLTEQMASYMKISQPYCVVEGIAPEPEEIPAAAAEDREQKTILYSGTLHKQFGIINLLEAFSGIEKENYRLVICGVGDAEREIKAAADKDSRIHYLGQLPRREALRLQRSATVLVNPRQNTGEYVKYSFPSKNLEYLQSGRPLIAYKLDGIPDEYDDYIFYVSDHTVDALRDRLLALCEHCEDDAVREKCAAAREFVTRCKNAGKQAAVIADMLYAKGMLNFNENKTDQERTEESTQHI